MYSNQALKVSLLVITLAGTQVLDVSETYVGARTALAANNSQQVVMYATSWCGYCKKARDYLKQNNIKYVEYDIERSAEGKRRFKELGGRGVPLILVGTQQIRGWNPNALKAALSKTPSKSWLPSLPFFGREKKSAPATSDDDGYQGMSAVSFITPSSDSGHRYTIHLRDQRTISVEEYWEEGDQIKYEKFGGLIGVERKDVVRIEDTVSGTTKRYK